MAAERIFETVSELTDMQKYLPETTLVDLRDGYRSNPRQRIEKIAAAHPNTNNVSSTGGSSRIYVKIAGRIKERHTLGGVTVHHLHPFDRSLPLIGIYPYGIEGVTNTGSPIFQDPTTHNMRAVVLEYPRINNNLHWLQRPIEPLFNIDQDGVVLARIYDQPTPTELRFLYDILDQFEAASQIKSY